MANLTASQPWAKQLEPTSQLRDSEYVEEYSVLKFLRGKLACYLHDFQVRCHWFVRLRLPPPNGRHDQLYEHRIRRLMRRVVQRSGCLLGAVKGQRFKSSAAWTLGIRTFWASSLSTAGGRGATTRMCGWTLSSSFPRPHCRWTRQISTCL